MTAQEVQNSIVEDFSFFEDWTEKYEYIIDCGRELEPLPDEHKVEENKVIGCQSHVWLQAEMRDGLIHYTVASEALIVKGLAALLLRVYNDRTPQDVLTTQPDFINAIGMTAHLSPTRSNGLASMVKHIKAYALGLQSINTAQ